MSDRNRAGRILRPGRFAVVILGPVPVLAGVGYVLGSTLGVIGIVLGCIVGMIVGKALSAFTYHWVFPGDRP